MGQKHINIMRKILFLIAAVLIPLCINAQTAGLFGASQASTKQASDYSAYMEGSVPEVNGQVVFSKTISAEGKSRADIYRSVAAWASARFMADVENGKWNDPAYFRNLQYARVTKADSQSAQIECQGNEEQVFSNKILAKDYTVIDYVLAISISDGKATATMRNIVYTYDFQTDRERRGAEQVITDLQVFNKNGQWIKQNRKFRVKTVDLANELFREIEQAVQ